MLAPTRRDTILLPNVANGHQAYGFYVDLGSGVEFVNMKQREGDHSLEIQNASTGIYCANNLKISNVNMNIDVKNNSQHAIQVEDGKAFAMGQAYQVPQFPDDEMEYSVNEQEMVYQKAYINDPTYVKPILYNKKLVDADVSNGSMDYKDESMHINATVEADNGKNIMGDAKIRFDRVTECMAMNALYFMGESLTQKGGYFNPYVDYSFVVTKPNKNTKVSIDNNDSKYESYNWIMTMDQTEMYLVPPKVAGTVYSFDISRNTECANDTVLVGMLGKPHLVTIVNGGEGATKSTTAEDLPLPIVPPTERVDATESAMRELLFSSITKGNYVAPPATDDDYEDDESLFERLYTYLYQMPVELEAGEKENYSDYTWAFDENTTAYLEETDQLEYAMYGGEFMMPNHDVTATVLWSREGYYRVNFPSELVGMTIQSVEVYNGEEKVAENFVNGDEIQKDNKLVFTIKKHAGYEYASLKCSESTDSACELSKSELEGDTFKVTLSNFQDNVALVNHSVIAEPTIKTQPVGGTFTKNEGSHTLSVEVEEIENSADELAYSYQWYESFGPRSGNHEDNGKIEGATKSTYVVPTDTSIGDHTYYCVVTVTGKEPESGVSKKFVESDYADVRVLSQKGSVVVNVNQEDGDTRVATVGLTPASNSSAKIALVSENKKMYVMPDTDSDATPDKVNYGLYKVTVTLAEKEFTEALVVGKSDNVLNVTIPNIDGTASTIVTKTGNVPSVEVSGLNALIPETVSNGTHVEIKTTVSEKDTVNNEAAKKDKEDIVKAADFKESETTAKVELIDLTVMQTTTINGDETNVEQTTLTDLGSNYIYVNIGLVEDYQSSDLRVLRIHDGKPEELKNYTTKGMVPANTEGFIISSDKTIATLVLNKFSTYALVIGEKKEATQKPENNPISGGGSFGTIAPSEIIVPATEITLNKVGAIADINASVAPSNATDKTLTYTSSDEKVVIVDKNGRIKAIGKGTATITISTKDGKITKMITVTVKALEEDKPSKDDNISSSLGDGTSFTKLQPVVSKNTKTTVTLKWKKQSDADGYLIYGNKCNTAGHKYSLKLMKTVSADKLSVTLKSLKAGTYYKYKLKAYKIVNGKKVIIAETPVIHTTTKGGKYGVAKSVRIDKIAGKKINSQKAVKFSLAKGKKAQIKATEIKENKPIKKHRGLVYETSNKSVATVSKTGKIIAKKKGTCKIYIYAQNGIYNTITVTVK